MLFLLSTLVFSCWQSVYYAQGNYCPGGLQQNISNQAEIDQLMKVLRGLNTLSCIHLVLAGGNSYKMNIIELMTCSGSTTDHSLIMESQSGLAEVNCTAGSSDLDGQALQPLSRASLVLLDGLIFTGCPVPMLLEEASNIIIQNCIFQ